MRHCIKAIGPLGGDWNKVMGLFSVIILMGACSIDSGKGGVSQSTMSDSMATTQTRLIETTTSPVGQEAELNVPRLGKLVNVVTTLYPLEYFIQRVGGNSVYVINVVSPGVEAHGFEPTLGDVRILDTADLIIYNGLGFEPWLDRAMQAIGVDTDIIVEAGRDISGLTYRETFHMANWHDKRNERRPSGSPEFVDPQTLSGIDPHVWLDPLKAMEQVRRVRDSLSRVNPGEAKAYKRNADELLAELNELRKLYVSQLAECQVRHFVVSHEAFAYLAQPYGLEQVPVSGLAPEAEPSPRDLARIADYVRSLSIGYVMVEPGASRRLAETVAAEVDAEVLTLHPLESLTLDERSSGENYFSLMEANLSNLRIALECT